MTTEVGLEGHTSKPRGAGDDGCHELGRAKQGLSILREQGPADTSVLGFWPPELREYIFAVSSCQVCGIQLPGGGSEEEGTEQLSPRSQDLGGCPKVREMASHR